MAIDCEMVETKGGRDEVAHVSVVSRSGVLYDKYVRPEGEITDYRTAFSGITPEIIHNCTNGCDPTLFSHSLQNRPTRGLRTHYQKTHHSYRTLAGERSRGVENRPDLGHRHVRAFHSSLSGPQIPITLSFQAIPRSHHPISERGT